MLTLLPDDPKAAEQVVRLTNDLAASRTALVRTSLERNQWREAYQALQVRMNRLCGVQEQIAELRGKQA